MTHTSKPVQNSGKIIILDGTTTAGKSVIANHLTSLLDTQYEQVSVDDFHILAFEEQQKLNLSIKEFLVRIRQTTDAMYNKIINLASAGKTVIVDVVLSGHEGKKDVDLALKRLNDFNVTLVLVYCPLVMVVERIKRRNEKAISKNNPYQIRSRVIAFKFENVYKPQEQNNETYLGILSRKDVETAYDSPRKEWGEDAGKFDSARTSLIKHFGLNNNESVKITPCISYDCIVDTSINNHKECASQIYKHLKSAKIL